MPVELSDDPVEGLEGPTLLVMMNKRSEHFKEWRLRHIVIQGRRMYYYECEDDVKPCDGKPMGMHKGWLDLTGAKVTTWEESEEAEKFYGVQIQEEYGLTGLEQECEGGKYVLCSSNKEEQKELIETLKYACRARWLDDNYSQVCMHAKEPFSFFERRHHCRRCGGLFLADSMVEKPLPEMAYDYLVLVCYPCHEGGRASRWLTKVPKTERPMKRKDMSAEVTDSVVDTARKTFTAMGNFLTKISSED
eukprot:TRINITY_DN881_c0_g3_i1.p1 TRINITY_DN881_c0_g3~~TRINITY_DN881_c0_g3_i1.p1  ORF type:complete len:265 (+),score=52.83 TRINITY_DN881_c0_g3_i1:53-796(+)